MPTMDIMGEDMGNFKTKMKAVFLMETLELKTVFFKS